MDSALANNRAEANRQRGHKIVVENGGKHPCGSTSLLYLSRDKGGMGMRSIETEYKETKMKAAVNLY